MKMKSTIFSICLCILLCQPIFALKPIWCGLKGTCEQINAICLEKTLTCTCPLGYWDEGDYCSKQNCRESKDCAAKFPNSECVNADHCGRCARGFFLDPEAQICKAKHQIDSACTGDHECGLNAVCSKDLNRCVCASNQFMDLTTNCVPRRCDVREDCTPTLGYFSQCTENKQCACTEDYTFDIPRDQCVLKYKLIGENCTKQTDCGQNAFCQKMNNENVGFCACKLAHKKLNDYQCEEFYCREDRQCNSTWGFYDTYCNLDTHRCACQEGRAVGASGRCEKVKSAGYTVKSLEMFSFVSLFLGIVLIFM